MLTKIKRTVAGLAAAAVLLGMPAGPAVAAEKVKIYLNLSYTGNSWMNQATNIIRSLAKTPPYDELIEYKEIVSGLDLQAQISAYESMIADGADGIISFPLSSTGLNRAIKRGCEVGVVMMMFAQHVTEDCAYDMAYIGSGLGENNAQWLVNELKGKGKIFLSRGIPGHPIDKRHVDGAMSVFSKYPGIEIVAEYYGMWDDQITQTETAKALVAHPDVDGIWAQAGEFGAIKALLASKRERLVAITGENSAGFRRALIDPELKARGLTGLSSGDSPIIPGITFKIMMEMVLKQREFKNHHMAYPLPWVPGDQVKLCEGDRIENGCNTFPKEKVPDDFISNTFDPEFAPEIALISALEGKPTPGMSIQPLPEGDLFPAAQNLPGINCNNCELPKDAYALTKIKPFDAD
ncbi:sugar ABC transporter substrate-binding protein [Aminobacter sp. MSH1]|uniref:sugar ABC transporter substrate-binding protein n=1 Tax=Aminobacter sp. MSH1 TaxID=374606 RepID=UPI000D33D69C|nr:sugar ABC transporter substrate-binding protein [Aminobacter sp. MSH1]